MKADATALIDAASTRDLEDAIIGLGYTLTIRPPAMRLHTGLEAWIVQAGTTGVAPHSIYATGTTRADAVKVAALRMGDALAERVAGCAPQPVDRVMAALAALAETEPYARSQRALSVALVASTSDLPPAEVAEVAAAAFDPRSEWASAQAARLRAIARSEIDAVEYGEDQAEECDL